MLKKKCSEVDDENPYRFLIVSSVDISRLDFLYLVLKFHSYSRLMFFMLSFHINIRCLDELDILIALD